MKYTMFGRIIGLLIIGLIDIISANDYRVDLKNDGPIVKGGTIVFNASVYYQDKLASNEYFYYIWKDEAIPQHSKENGVKIPTDTWSITYNASIYPGGTYIAQVVVKKCVFDDVFCYELVSARSEFEITETLNGDLELLQKNETRPDTFVSSRDTVVHLVDLKKSDRNYINRATMVLTYWFVDCTYYGITTDFKFPFNYTIPDESHVVEALVVADFTPPPPTTTVAPTTTTTTTIKPTTTPTSTTTIKPTTKTPSTTTIKPTTKLTSTTKATTVKPTTPKPTASTVVTASMPSSTFIPSKLTTLEPSTTIIKKNLIKRDVQNLNYTKNLGTSKVSIGINGMLVPYHESFPMVCNGAQVSTDDDMKSYGYFHKEVRVRAPLSKVNVTGNNWIQPGDLLSLQVSCSGSKNMLYCVEYRRGEYNITGNETCDIYYSLSTCDFTIRRYLSYQKNTILIIIKNEVSKVITPVTVNIYKVNKQAQLSVIVVPVAFSLVAVVLIVFGIAYYFQNRSRFIIEVADFNFGQQYSDMDYKTFRERLKDSIVNAFTRAPSPSSSEVPVWPAAQKYGSMT